MFEAIILVCANLADGPCREQLLPGFEAREQSVCEAALLREKPRLPKNGKGEPACVPTGDALPVTEVAPGVFVHSGLIEEPNPENRGDVSNLGFVVGDKSVAVVDTGTARWMGEALWRSIRGVTDKPVSHVILSHMHPDHVFGATPFVEAGATLAAHSELPRALSDRVENYTESLERLVGVENFLGTDVAMPTVLIDDKATIDLGNRSLQLTAWPAAHTSTDLTVLDETTGILFAGDLVFHRHTPALDGKLIGWRQVLNDLETRHTGQVIPGHGDHMIGWPEGGADIARYLEVLETDAREAVEKGMRLGEAVEVIAESEAEFWLLFDEFNPRNATTAFTELEWE